MKPSTETRERIAIYLPESVVTDVRVVAAHTRLSMSQIAEMALSQYLDKRKKSEARSKAKAQQKAEAA